MLYFCGDDDEERCCLFPKLERSSKKLFKEISLTPLQNNTISAAFGFKPIQAKCPLKFSSNFSVLRVLAFNKNHFHLFSSGLSQAGNNKLYTVYLCRTRWLKLEAYGRDNSLRHTL